MASENSSVIQKRKFNFPHPIFMMVLIAFFFYLLTFVIQPGVYDTDEATGQFIADSFHYVERTPVSLWKLLLSMNGAFTSRGQIIGVLMGMACYTQMIITVGAIDTIVKWATCRLKDKSVAVLVPCIVVLMSVMGALAGNDGFAAFVAVGLVLSYRLKLDKIAAIGMFYLPYISAQSVGPTTAMILAAQSMVGLPALSGIWVRLIIWPIITAFTAFWVTRYCLKVQKNPEASLSKLDVVTHIPEDDLEEAKLSTRSVLAFILLFAPFILFAVGSSQWGWNMDYLFLLPLLDAVLIGLIYGKSSDEICSILMRGGSSMGGVVLTFGIGSMVGTVLNQSNITGTIAHAVASAVGQSGELWIPALLFIFITLVNLLTPSGMAKLMWIIPLMQPITSALGISDQMLCLIYQLGDGFTNFITPLSTVLLTCMMLAKVKLDEWLKFAVPYSVVLIAFSSIVLFLLQLFKCY